MCKHLNIIKRIAEAKRDIEGYDDYDIFCMVVSPLNITDLVCLMKLVNDCPKFKEFLSSKIENEKEDFLRNQSLDVLLEACAYSDDIFSKSARSVIKQRFYDMSNEDRKKTLVAFLFSEDREDRNWAYRELFNEWYPEFYGIIASRLNPDSYPYAFDTDCYMVVLRHFSLDFIKQYRNLFYNPIMPPSIPNNYGRDDIRMQLQIRLAEDNDYTIQTYNLSTLEYLRVIAESGRTINKDTAVRLLFTVASEDINDWEIIANAAINDYYWEGSYSIFDFKNVIEACQFLNQASRTDVVFDFIKWDKTLRNRYYPSSLILENKREISNYFRLLIDNIIWHWPRKFNYLLKVNMSDGFDLMPLEFMSSALFTNICEEQELKAEQVREKERKEKGIILSQMSQKNPAIKELIKGLGLE